MSYGDSSVASRLGFLGDPRQGDASISISAVKVSDTATYQCKVKKAPGVDMRKVTLVVMGEEHRLRLLHLPDWFLFYQFHPSTFFHS